MQLSKFKPSQVLVAITFITFFLLLLSKVKSNDDLSFQFKKFKPDGKDLNFDGNGSTSVLETGVLRLNKVGNDLPREVGGRARYVAPVHVWDKNTGEVASFVTSFSFVMEKSVNISSDGMTLFLAPPNSQLRRSGGFLGLFNDTKCDSSYQTVAVEFDTIGSPQNTWDLDYPHIGIDVNCVSSIKTVRWDKRYGLNNVANVVIIYEASTKTLTALLTYPSVQTSITVSASVDLKAILPEWVRVGFTGTTFQGLHFF